MIKTVYPYLSFVDEGQAAIKFYEIALEAKVINIKTFGDMPPNPERPLPEEIKDRILNAHLKIGNTNLMISDSFPGSDNAPTKGNSQISIVLITNDPEKTEEVFNRLKENGTVTMPLQKTFWSPAYGHVTDKFGVTWQISTELDEEN
ncbi:VOC family protein [Pseudogracilibacillus sp. SE30717A]|uniref:VOC family protein n=1 Tax=Pseudogracilibacillus sp. SE30717A TaxID=3098293 RepID=UPI00300E473D